MTVAEWCVFGTLMLYLLTIASVKWAGHRHFDNARPRDPAFYEDATREAEDPIRFLSNRSSGKMGFALAEEARRLGATVRLIVARTSEPPPGDLDPIEARTATAMRDAVLGAMEGADALIMAAAVSDFTPAAARFPRGETPRPGRPSCPARSRRRIRAPSRGAGRG